MSDSHGEARYQYNRPRKTVTHKQHAKMTTTFDNVDVTAYELGKLVQAGYTPMCPSFT